MRCVSCGLPLSLSRANCPRCGTAVAGVSKERSSGHIQGRDNLSPSQRDQYSSAGAQHSWDAPQPLWNNNPPSVTWNMQEAPFVQPNHSDQQLAFPEMGTPTSYPSNWPSPSQSGLITPNAMRQAARPFPQTPRRSPKHTTSRWSARTGFTMAALCILVGGLILASVYIIVLGLPPSSPSTASLGKSVTAIQNISPTPISSPVTSDVTPTLVASPTVTYPGQLYIDNARMASSSIASPTTLVTHFKVNQRIFVTFLLHPDGHSGAVCLLWYLNSRQFTHYEFPVGAIPSSAYSFASANYLGTGYVEIYWASTVACTDKLLAQRVSFTVEA